MGKYLIKGQIKIDVGWTSVRYRTFLSWKSQRNDTDQQEIRRTTFSMSPRAKPHTNRINYHRKGAMLQVVINFMHWANPKEQIYK